MTKNIHDYQDIINLPHHISIKHPQMSLEDRAAQFAPFAALTGHKDSIKETERLTAQRKILDEDRIAIINFRLQQLLKHLTEAPLIKITYRFGFYDLIARHLRKEFSCQDFILKRYFILTFVFKIELHLRLVG